MSLMNNSKYYLSYLHNDLINNNYNYKDIYNVVKKNINNDKLDEYIIDNIKKLRNYNNNIEKNYIIEELKNKNKYEYYPWVQYNIDNKKNISFNDFLYEYHTNLDFQDDINEKYNDKYNKIINKYDIDKKLIILLKMFNEFYFISLDIKLYSLNNIDRLLYIKTDIFTLKLYYENNIYNDKIKDIYNKINIIIKLMKNIKKNNRYLNIFIILSPIKKNIYDNNKILSPYNVNSGLSSINKDILCIWRYEDLFKVLIHELIHYYDLDIKKDNKIDNILNISLGNNNYPIYINEAITELLAIFYHSIFITYYIDYSNLLKSFKTLLLYEIMFSWLQLYKISKHYNISSFNNFFNNNLFNQTSNVFSYYIIKCFYTIDIINNIYAINYNCSINKCNHIIKLTKNIDNNPDNFIQLYNNFINSNIQFNDNNIKLILFDIL